MRQILTWLLVLLAFAGSPALAQSGAAYPARPDGPVLDQANVIPDADEAALDAKLRAYNQRTGRALVVATVSSLDGETIEMYAVKLFEQWGIGGKESDQGLLLLVAPNDRKLRFETGYGLHAIFPDVLAGRVIRDVITPRFKSGDLPGGINAGMDAVITQLDRTPADAKAVAEAAAAAEAQRSAPEEAGFASVIFWIVVILFFMSIFGRGRRGARRSGIDPGIVLWGASEIARHMSDRGGGGGFDFGGGGGGFGGFGGGGSGGGGASGSW